MARYLVAIHHPDTYEPLVVEDAAMSAAIDALNVEMKEAGVRFFAGGLHPAKYAKSVRAEANGDLKTTDGPYLRTSEHVGGFWILDVADLEAAMMWARKATVACRAPVEVRAFH